MIYVPLLRKKVFWKLNHIHFFPFKLMMGKKMTVHFIGYYIYKR